MPAVLEPGGPSAGVVGKVLVDAYPGSVRVVQGVVAVAIVGFVVVLVLWLAFGGVLLLRREALDGAWYSFRHQSRVVQGLEAVVLLPWVVALAVWESKWALAVRVVLVVGLAWATIFAFLPRGG
jgi:hypothetical protein